jgi:hypothetical protein
MSRIWLLGAVTLVVALLVGGVTVALVAGRGDAELLSSDSPEGVAQRYLLALEGEEFREAYDYLSDDVRRQCRYDHFLREASWTEVGESHVTLEGTRVVDDRAQVKARFTIFDPEGLFGASERSYDRTFHLKLENGQWWLGSIPETPWRIWCPPY